MPHFVFNVHDGVSLTPMKDGFEFDDLEAAEHAAALTAAEIGFSQVQKGKGADCQVIVEVRDEHRQRVATVTWHMRIDRLVPLPPGPWGT